MLQAVPSKVFIRARLMTALIQAKNVIWRGAAPEFMANRTLRIQASTPIAETGDTMSGVPGRIFQSSRSILGVKTTALMALLVAALSWSSGPLAANPYFATQTGRACGSCHQAGREMSGTRGLNWTGTAFLQAFRSNPERALREYAAGGNQRRHFGGFESSGNCTARFNCSGDTAFCLFRIFGRNGGSRTIEVNGGQWRRFSGLHRGDQFCSSSRGRTPSFDCNRHSIRMDFCN